jgi:hypothetical protein
VTSAETTVQATVPAPVVQPTAPSQVQSTAGGAQPGTPAGTLPTANAASHRHHGVFRSPVNATQALSLVLLLDSFLLAAIVMWRAARLWVIPRFA